MIERLLPPSPLQVWVCDHESAQLTWGYLPAGPIKAQATPADGAKTDETQLVNIDHPGGPGGLTITGLAPDAKVEITVRWADKHWSETVMTLGRPPGALLTRFATISDLHIGAERFGFLKTMADNSGHPVPHPMRCAQSAIAELQRWGADFLLIKGDAVDHELAENFADLGDLLDSVPDLEIMLLPGNHDVDARGKTIPTALGERKIPYVRSVEARALPGITIVGADSTLPGRSWGSPARVAKRLIQTVTETKGPVFVAFHHQLHPTRLPRYYPPGIQAPWSTRILDDLDELANPVVVSSGHTHRNRVRMDGSVTVTEVGSTKDWPGVWAGYSVFEGGIVQTVRRIENPEAADWVEFSRGAVLGLWSRWSPGTEEDLAFSLSWE